MKVTFARRARREIERRSLVGPESTAGPVYRVVGGHEQRRLLMPKTAHHLYYRVAAPDEVIVLSIWGARRGRGPAVR